MERAFPDIFACIRCMTYNQSAYIADALNGFCMQQTSFPFLAIVMDDASTDGEQVVIEDYIKGNFLLSDISCMKWETEEAKWIFAQHRENPNCSFLVIFLKRNMYKQKQTKLELIKEWEDKSEYIALCEGDDYWTDPLKLQKQVDFMEANEDVGMCFTDYYVRNQQGKISQPVFRTGMDRIPLGFEDHLLRAGYIAPMSWMWRSSCKELLRNYKAYSDGSFAMALELYKNSKVVFLENATCVYRISEGTASRPKTQEKQFQYQLGVYKTQLYYADKYKVGSELVDRIKSKAYFEMLPLALEMDQKDFIEEATAFFASKNIYYAGLMGLCRQLNDERRENCKIEKELLGVRSSKAYRIGKRMTKVFGGIAKKLKK